MSQRELGLWDPVGNMHKLFAGEKKKTKRRLIAAFSVLADKLRGADCAAGTGYKQRSVVAVL